MDFLQHAYLGELEKIAEEKDKKKARRRKYLMAGGAALATAGGLYGGARLARHGAVKLQDAFHKATAQAADRLGDGMRAGIHKGFEEGVQSLEKRVPHITESAASSLRPHINEVIDDVVRRAQAEAAELGREAASGMTQNIWGIFRRRPTPRLPGK